MPDKPEIKKSRISGAGIGLRTPHLPTIFAQQPEVPWFELLVDNWLVSGGTNLKLIQAVAERYACVLHGVGLSIGSIDPLDTDYLNKIKHFKTLIGAHWYSEHASFSSCDGLYVPDLLPLPYTEEAVKHLSQRVNVVQDYLGEQILIENISSYIDAPENTLREGEFLAAVASECHCALLVDINNVFVSCSNLGHSTEQFLADIAACDIKQIHLAGFKNNNTFLLDSHGAPVAPEVWSLYDAFLQQHGAIPTLIEWDNEIPEFDILMAERSIAQIKMDTYQLQQAEAI